ncbi:MAG: B12-binding domain-containing radical SAM protein [Paludibacterium sp.]|uniref:B12-binding domain-containing radical SAM protein n=1 Tax=Paludibacterium sp. TaxID=1917523 RepID=UPI0025D652F1|nr:radical SAM protein [Paludibacterium sp.]MBV8048821.1 B12-binding domain-containing radical SAM protein [Paludibacterium sp.]MBV8646304.1 B12-binding domain-containing radical SAM protein [Paludibacterium sp.]
MKKEKIMFVVMPYEGEVLDRVTAKFYKNKAVKYMPLGVLSIAATIPVDRYDVQVLDAASLGLSLDETIEAIENWAPDVLGLSVVTYRAWAMTEILKRTSAPCKVVGGPHATKNYRYILQQGAHAVFVDDGEVIFPEWLDSGRPPGVYFGGQVDLNALPLPARHLLDIDIYRIEKNEDLLFDVGSLRLPMFSSKGCPYSCTYCDVQQKTFNMKSAERCVEEFKELIRLGATSIHILDDAFNVNRARVSDISRALIAENINIDWSARGTVEVREDVIADLADAGCRRLHVGIESLDDDILATFKKASRYKHIEQFCKLCDKYGIDILGYFIVGAPGETTEYRRTLPGRIRDLGIKLPYFNLLSPLAETPYYEQLLREGRFEYDVWQSFCRQPVRDFIIPEIRSVEEEDELRQMIDRYVEHFKRDDMPVFVS